MATPTTEELLTIFESMTVLELSEFVKAFEEKFEVTAAAPVAMAAVAAGGDGGAAAAEEEKDEFDVYLVAAGDKEDPGHQGGSIAHQPRPQGCQGSRRQRTEARPRGGRQGDCREGQGRPRGRRRLGGAQVTITPFRVRRGVPSGAPRSLWAGDPGKRRTGKWEPDRPPPHGAPGRDDAVERQCGEPDDRNDGACDHEVWPAASGRRARPPLDRRQQGDQGDRGGDIRPDPQRPHPPPRGGVGHQVQAEAAGQNCGARRAASSR